MGDVPWSVQPVVDELRKTADDAAVAVFVDHWWRVIEGPPGGLLERTFRLANLFLLELGDQHPLARAFLRAHVNLASYFLASRVGDEAEAWLAAREGDA